MPAMRYSSPAKSYSDIGPDLMSSSYDNDDYDHPLLSELASLRTSLRKFQHSSHASSMQLQSKIMESMLIKEEKERIQREVEALKLEIQSYSKSSQQSALPSTDAQALSELTIAHRRLSSKLDHLSSAYEISQTAVATREAEASTYKKERDIIAILLQEWKDRLVSCEKEKEEQKIRRIAVEEELRITKLALKQYEDSASVSRVDSPIDTAACSPSSLEADLKLTARDIEMSSSSSTILASNHSSLPSTPSNIMLGIKGLHRLVSDFETALGESQAKVAELGMTIEEIKGAKVVAEEQAAAAREISANLLTQVELIKADNFGAGKVVERYMAFTQKTTQQLHDHMQTANNRLSQTISHLRAQLFSSQTMLAREESRSKQLRSAIDELAEGYERETFGRRREVGLRVKALEREERRSEEGKRWTERVRRERTRLNVIGPAQPSRFASSPTRHPARLNSLGGNAASASSTSLSSMLGAPPVHDYAHEERLSLLWDMLESGVQLFKENNENLVELADASGSQANGEFNGGSPARTKGRTLDVNSSLGRILLAQEIVSSLTADLERETRRNVVLEKERLSLVSTLPEGKLPMTEAIGKNGSTSPVCDEPVTLVSTTPPANEDVSDKFEMASPSEDDQDSGGLEDEGVHNAIGISLDVETVKDTTDPFLLDTSYVHKSQPSPRLTTLLEQLRDRTPHYLSTQKALHDCAISLVNLRRDCRSLATSHQASLQTVLDGIHDVIEDVRVEVEIALADDDRASKGHHTVLTLNPDDKAMELAESFVKGDRSRVKETNFGRRLGDVEHDLVELKMAIMRVKTEEDLGPQEELMDVPNLQDVQSLGPFSQLSLKTVTVRPSAVTPLSNDVIPKLSPGLNDRSVVGNGMKRGFFPALGRTFSGTTPVLSRTTSSGSAVGLHSNSNLMAGKVAGVLSDQAVGREGDGGDDVE